MKRTTLLVVAFAVVATTMLGARVASAAALACDATTGTPGAGECQITTAKAVTGAVEVDRTLHILGSGRLDASGAGITLRVCVAPAPAFATCDLIMDTPTVVGGGEIEADDTTTTNGAFPIDIAVSRDVLMHDRSKILSENVLGTGGGGNITIVAGRDMTMDASAKISASKYGGSGGSGVQILAGNITITVGDVVGHTSGVFTMGPSTQTDPNDQKTKSGILANSIVSAGAIAILAGKEMHVGGLVESFSGLTGTGAQQNPGGGPITVVSGCKLFVEDTGKISSEGQDPGADLVHLEGCDVVIQGLVQSIAPGKGHSAPTTRPNHCNLDQIAHPTVLDAKIYEGCVEIWANTVTIDSTGTHKGKVNVAGMRSPGRAWIDIFARGDITIIADTALLNYSVNADACNGVNAPNAPCSNSLAGLVNIKSQSGAVVMTALAPGTNGRAVSASAIVPTGIGGRITVEAGGASGGGSVNFTADSLVARSNGSQIIGRIDVQSFNDQVLGVSPGSLDTLVPSVNGAVNLTACVGDPAVTYSGTVTGTRINAGPGVDCGGTPTFPTVAQWYTGRTVAQFLIAAASCAQVCGTTCTPSGIKFNDLAGNGVKDPGDSLVQGFQIHLFEKTTGTPHLHTTTDINGAWAFSVLPGEYIVCEQGGPAPNSPAQTFPLTDGSGGLCETHTGVTGSRGYDITLNADVNACASADNDFGNFFGASISGHKFNDLANNGVKDPVDPALAGTQVHLFLQTGGGDQHAITDDDGNFAFVAVTPGNYYLCEQGGPAPNTPQQTFPATDGSAGACATYTGIPGSRGYAITLGANQVVDNQDFGNYFGGTVSGQKFSDLANDGVKGAGDPGVPGMQIILIDKGTGGGTVNLTTNTDAGGNFSFGLILPGEYYLCEQAGPAPNIPAQTFPATDQSSGACAARTGIAGSRGYALVLGVNGTSSNQNFGNFYGGAINGQKFNDLNGDGVKSGGEPGVPGLIVHLFLSGGGGDQQTTTDASGNYIFGLLQPGTYIVCEQGGPAPNKPAQTFPATDGSGGQCAAKTGIAGSRGYTVVLATNGLITSMDFGNYFAGTITGRKFSDVLSNGVRDPDDLPLSGVLIHLFDRTTRAATVHLHTFTDGNGNYSFTVQPGDYTICEQGGPAPFVPAQTFPASDGTNGACETHTGIAGSRGYDITVTVNQTVINQDFGNHFLEPPPPPPDVPVPTIGDFALGLLAALLALLGIGGIARRRRL